MKQVYSVLIFISCISCSRQNQQEKAPQQQVSNNPQHQELNSIEEVPLKHFTYEDIARYAIATIMDQSPSIIRAVKNNDLYLVSYVRKSDSQKFDYKIKIDGNHVIWGNSDGRWRDTDFDEKIGFVEDGNKIKIIQTFTDGSEAAEEFEKGQ